MIHVYLCGEGKNDIGRWALEVRDGTSDGVLGALAKRVRDTGWKAAGGCPWKKLTSLRVGGGGSPLSRKLRQLEQLATDAGCDAILFGFDVDNRPERGRELDDALAERSPNALPLAGAAVDPCIEGWVLELHGERPKGGWSKAKAQARVAELGLDFTDAMERAVEQWSGKRGALSERLGQWLSAVERALVQPVPSRTAPH